MSAAHSNGKTMPVEALPPKTIAMMVTLSMSIPFKPALASPIINAPRKINSRLAAEYAESISLIVAMYFQDTGISVTICPFSFKLFWTGLIFIFCASPSGIIYISYAKKLSR